MVFITLCSGSFFSHGVITAIPGRSPFPFATNPSCSKCGAVFQREAGFYLGSIYFNYGLTTLILAVAYPLLLLFGVLSNDVLLWTALAFVVMFPVLFFRHARSLWLGFDQLWDPRPGEVGTGREPDDP